jgi:hypothetical protein
MKTSAQKIVDLKCPESNICISLPENGAQKLMVELNIALDRIRCISSIQHEVTTHITREEKDIIMRARLENNHEIK